MRWRIAILTLLVAASCADTTPLPIEPANLTGTWLFESGNERELLSFKADGSFEGTVYRTGFVARTLSQGPEAKVHGSWHLTGDVLSVRIDASPAEQLVGASHDFEVLALSQATMTVRDGADGGRIEVERHATLDL